jgi:hypothetical protein
MRRKRKRKINGSGRRRRVNSRKHTKEARNRVLNRALKRGAITNDEAKRVGGWAQSWYHLHKLAKAGVLKRTAYNTWEPIRRRGRPSTILI